MKGFATTQGSGQQESDDGIRRREIRRRCGVRLSVPGKIRPVLEFNTTRTEETEWGRRSLGRSRSS